MNEISFDEIDDREKLRRFVEGNRIAEEQTRLGLSKPLDLDVLLQRVEMRLNIESQSLTPES